jgi:hypothetical protein
MRSSIQTTICAYANVSDAEAGQRHALREHLRMPVCCAAAGGLAIAGNHKLQRCVFQAYGRVRDERPRGRFRAFQSPRPGSAAPRALNRKPDPSSTKTIPSPARVPTSWPVRARPSSGNAGIPEGAPGWGAPRSEAPPAGEPAAGGGRKGSFPCALAGPARDAARHNTTSIRAARLIRPRYDRPRRQTRGSGSMSYRTKTAT